MRHTMKRKTRKGGYYGFTGAVGTGAPEWSRATEVAPLTGGGGQCGARRRKRTSKKTKRRHRKQRAGSRFSTASASYQGTGSRGIADYVPVTTRGEPGSAAGGSFNNYGVQPGGGHSSFVTAGPK